MAKVEVRYLKPSEAILFTPPGGKEDVYVMVSTSNGVFTGTRVGNKSPYTFKAGDQVTKIEALPEFPSAAIGPILLALK